MLLLDPSICPRCHEKVEPVMNIKLRGGEVLESRRVQCIIGPDFAEHVGTCPIYLREI